MIKYFTIVGITTHLILLLTLLIYGINSMGNIEVGSHEYAMTSIYSDQEFMYPGIKDVIKDIMSDGKVTYNEYGRLLKYHKMLENKKYHQNLINNLSH